MTRTTDTEVGPAETPTPPHRPKRPSRRLVLTVGGVVVFAVLAVWITAFSPVLGVRSVQVRGNRLLTQAEVRSAAAVKHGAPLLRLDTAAIARRVEQLPEVKSATVDTHLPNTVTVTVVERAAVGFIQKADDAFVLVDAEGTQFRTVKLRPRRLPLLVLPGGAQASPSSAAVATVAGDLDAGLLSRIQSIQALDPTAITLVLTDGRVVRWGSVARSADKARLLPALLAQPGTQFDVSNPDLVVSR